MSGSLAKILVVDDEPHVLDGLERTLRREVTLTRATSAREALEFAKDYEFAVVLTDLSMPGVDGWELIKALHTVSPLTICVVLTGQLEAVMPRVRPENLYALLHKPCSHDKLIDTLQAAVAEYVIRRSGGPSEKLA